MRQWHLDPRILCTKHILGEHVESHMIVGSILKGKSLNGFISTGLIEVHTVKSRHDELVQEMVRRGMNHKSPLPDVELYVAGKVDTDRNLKDLLSRCSDCKQRFETLWVTLNGERGGC